MEQCLHLGTGREVAWVSTEFWVLYLYGSQRPYDSVSSHRLEDDQDHLWLVLWSVKCVPATSPCHCMITREIRRLGKCHQMEGVGAAANNGLKWVPWVEWYEIFSPRWQWVTWVTAEDICSLLRAIPGPGAGLYKEEAWLDTQTRAVSCKVCVCKVAVGTKQNCK